MVCEFNLKLLFKKEDYFFKIYETLSSGEHIARVPSQLS